ncbi:two-component system, CitB family, response regulator [Paenibacillaceae bacterium GAS479]|nr:two-component system, CitB family, response regulator [Paenibacillaceae bacterium GAS479]
MEQPIVDGQASKIEVLIVEDDLRIAEINRRFLEQIPGFRVCGIASTEAQAKLQLELLEPHLVLLDIYLPPASGLDLLLYIRQHHRGTDTIMITAAREIDAVQEAIRSGAFDYLMKPLVFDRLKETMLRFAAFRRELSRLSDATSIGQHDIDRLLNRTADPLGSSEAGASLPKGIDKLTLDKVTQTIASMNDGLSAEKVAKLIGISRSTSRRYLEYLVGLGIIEADLSYGVGRPERVYRSRPQT